MKYVNLHLTVIFNRGLIILHPMLIKSNRAHHQYDFFRARLKKNFNRTKLKTEIQFNDARPMVQYAFFFLSTTHMRYHTIHWFYR